MALPTFASQNPVTVTNSDGSVGVTYNDWYCPHCTIGINMVGQTVNLSAIFIRCFVDSNGNINPAPAGVSPSVFVHNSDVMSDSVLGPTATTFFQSWVTELMTAGTLT